MFYEPVHATETRTKYRVTHAQGYKEFGDLADAQGYADEVAGTVSGPIQYELPSSPAPDLTT